MKAAYSEHLLPEYCNSGSCVEGGLSGFIKFLSPSKDTKVASRLHLEVDELSDEPEDEQDCEASDWEADEDEPPEAAPKPYKPKVYDTPVDERLQSCALGVVQAAFQFYVANQQTGGRLTHDQVVRAIHAELVTTSSPHQNKAKVYREAHEQIEQFLAVFVEAFAEISPAISLTKASSI